MGMSYGKTPVQSSNVKAVAFDDQSRELTVWFKNGSEYVYDGVQPSVGASFPYLESKGKGVWQILRKNNYPYKRIK